MNKHFVPDVRPIPKTCDRCVKGTPTHSVVVEWYKHPGKCIERFYCGGDSCGREYIIPGVYGGTTIHSSIAL